MIRIVTLLLLAILLLPAPPPGKPIHIRPGPLLVTPHPLPLSDDPDVKMVGALSFRGAWALTSVHPGFGGISALLVTPPGQVLALNDSGVLMGFHVGKGMPSRRSFIAPLPLREGERGDDWRYRDSEAMTHDPETDRYWVGFELQQMICRYGPG
ncbi:MAG: esterase-like activity of phytase family protein, partial [Sphingobium sp.]